LSCETSENFYGTIDSIPALVQVARARVITGKYSCLAVLPYCCNI